MGNKHGAVTWCRWEVKMEYGFYLGDVRPVVVIFLFILALLITYTTNRNIHDIHKASTCYIQGYVTID